MADQECQKQITIFKAAGLGFLGLSFVLLVAALFMPLRVEANPTGQERTLGKIKLFTLDQDKLSHLSSKAKGRLIIKAAQSQAAVKDNGLAAELAKCLRLQGIVDMSNTLTAYIRNTKTERTLSVREGDKLDDFIVTKISDQSVILDLDGVEVRLSY